MAVGMEHMAALQRTVSELREHCPWTAALDHESLAGYLTEEAEEVAEEIRAGVTGEPLRKELGDVLLQVVLHARLAEERGEFTLDDVAEAMYAKLVRRSPHVYRPDGTLDPQEASLEEIEAAWKRIKAQEKSEEGE